MTDPVRITGSLIMEERSHTFADGRVAVLVVGVIAMSKEDAAAYCAPRPKQAVVVGAAGGGLMRLGIVEGASRMPIDPEGDPDGQAGLMRHYECCRMDDLITAPIWRV